MSHEHESLPPNVATTDHPSIDGLGVRPSTPRTEPEPDFLTRARRILAGDVRPEDYLPLTPEVEAGVKLDLAGATAYIQKQFEAGRVPAVFEPDSSVGIRQRNDWLLSAHYGGQNIAYIENDRGVIVLAVGLEQGAALLDALPYQLRKDVSFGAPLPTDAIGLY